MSALACGRRGRALKAASKDLLDDISVKEAVHLLGRAGDSQLYRCASRNDAHNFLDLRDVVELERRATRPYVTVELCRQAGGVFLPLPDDFGADEGLPVRVCALAGELGDVSRSVTAALADGEVDGSEAALIERELDQLLECAAATRALVRKMQGKAPLRAVEEGEAAHG